MAAVILCGSCKKDSSNHAPVTSPYFPLTTGSKWTYLHYEEGLSNDTVTTQITGLTTLINAKTYYNASTSSKQMGLGTDYFYAGHHVYTIRSLNAFAGEVVELQLYNDTATVGQSNMSLPTDNGTVGGLPVRTINTLVETNLSLTIAGKPYTEIVHTHVDFQYDYKTGNGYETNFSYDFYLAKGIGMVAFNLTILGSETEAEMISSYHIN